MQQRSASDSCNLDSSSAWPRSLWPPCLPKQWPPAFSVSSSASGTAKISRRSSFAPSSLNESLIVASCLSASVPDAGVFRCGREFAAWIRLVSRQHSTGGKPRLDHISNMDNRRLRKLLVVGAHATLYRWRTAKPEPHWQIGPVHYRPLLLLSPTRSPNRLVSHGQGHGL